MKKHYQYDVLVIGSGAAGLTLALSLAQQARVAVLSKKISLLLAAGAELISVKEVRPGCEDVNNL